MDNRNENKTWKQDFPLRRGEAMQVTRRDFAKFLCLVSGGLALGNAIIAVRAFKKEKVNTDKRFICHSNEVPVGGTRSFVLSESTVPYILIHPEEGQWYAYEQKCTHLSCAVFYNPKEKKIECPCHNGWFDVATGEVLQGPPPRPLPKLEVVREGTKIFVRQTENA